QAGGADSEGAAALALTPAGEVVITGEFLSRSAQFGPVALANTSTPNRSDAFIARLDAAGTWQWALSSGGPGDEYGTALTIGSDGAVGVLGGYIGTATFGTTTLAGNAFLGNVFLAKVYESGPLAIAGLAPSSGAPGQTVTITGTGFVGVSEVLFNGTPAASFAVQTPTQLTAVVPARASAGPVSVRTTSRTASSAVPFTPTALSSTARVSGFTLVLNPNPTTDYVRLPGLPAGTRVQLVDAVGRVARETTVSAAADV
ncbi:IPT/TIG domain-containing protein, partial [Hymenobacter agri]